MSGKLSKAELKRLEELKTKLDFRAKKLDNLKKKYGKEKKQNDEERRKIATSWKELKSEQKKFAASQKLAEKQNVKSSVKAGNKKSDNGGKYKDQFFEMKKKYDQESKKVRDLSKKLGQLEAENKVLRNKLKNQKPRRKQKKDPRIAQLMRENRELRKKLRKMMRPIIRKRRYYNRAIKIFKNKQDKWVKAQKKAWGKKKFIIKYVFVGDVKKMKVYRTRKGKNKTKIKWKKKVRVRTKDGGETVLRDVEIEVLEGDDDSDDDDDDDVTDGSDDKDGKKKKKKKKKKGKGGDDDDADDDNDANGKKKKKKKKKSKAAKDDEMDDFMDGLMKEMGLDEEDDDNENLDDDDLKSIPSDDDDDEDDDEDDDDFKDDYADDGLADDADDDVNSAALEAQIVYLKQELNDRGRDLEKLKDILTNTHNNPDPAKAVDDLVNDIEARQNEMVENVEKVEGDTEPIKESNNEWKNWVLNLSKTIAANSDQFNDLIALCDHFLKELKGRCQDIDYVNNIYYDEEQNDDDKVEFDGVKSTVDERHSSITTDVDKYKEDHKDQSDDSDDSDNENSKKNKNGKVIEVYDNLVNNNVEWNERIQTSSNMFDESVKEKSMLIESIISKYQAIADSLNKVKKIPSTVL